MSIRLKHLLPVLLGVVLAFAETQPSSQTGPTTPAHRPEVEQVSMKSGSKTPAARSAADGRANEVARQSSAPSAQPVDVKYTVTQLDPPPKESGSWMSLSSGDMTVILAVFVAILLLASLIVWLLRRKGAESVPGGVAVLPQDAQPLIQSINAIGVKVGSLATSTALASAQTSINANITSLGNSLVPKIAEAAIAAMAKSELGDLRQKLSIASSELQKAKTDLEAKDSQLGAALERHRSAQADLTTVENDKTILSQRLLTIEGENHALKSDLAKAQSLIEAIKSDAQEQKAVADKLRAEANKSFDVLAPAKLRETDLLVQMQVLYQESLAGNPASIAAWTTLTAFVSAQADSSAKDFQLQIVRRLGLTLVSYWRHQGLSEKDRHDKLVHWAKSLNEHSDGRYNLLVPSLGEPVDRSRMSCATSVTAIREVLCWQVRNPAGANFSLAEVA